MKLNSYKLIKKRTYLEDLLHNNKDFSFKNTPMAKALNEAEKNLEDAKLHRDLIRMLMPMGVSMMLASSVVGFMESQYILAISGALGAGLIGYVCLIEEKIYRKATGLCKTKTHSHIIAQKMQEYEKELDNCIKSVEQEISFEK